jgi:hypothetical protein
VLDEEVVGVMADHYGLTRQAQAEQLLAWQYDTLTATYFLLLARRQAGKQFRILQPNPDLKPLPDLIADKVTYFLFLCTGTGTSTSLEAFIVYFYWCHFSFFLCLYSP